MKSLMLKSFHKSEIKNGTWCSNIIQTKQHTKKRIKNNFKNLEDFARKEFPKNGKFSLVWVKNVLLKIDELYYNNELFAKITKVYGGIKIEQHVSEEEIAGYILETDDGGITICMNRNLFMGLFSMSKNDSGYHSGGLLCTDRLVCLLHVLVHETVHIVLTLCEKLGKYGGEEEHGKDFMRITKHLFGHTHAKHGLIPGINHKHSLQTIEKNIKVGQHVKIFVKGKRMKGVILKKAKNHVEVQTRHAIYSVEAGLINI
jgi:hypothetical protein